MTNAEHISVVRAGVEVPDYSKACVLQRDMVIDPQALQDYCATLLTQAEHDLVVVCGAVAYADRMVPRKRGSGWARDLVCRIPVNAIEVWRQPAVVDNRSFGTPSFTSS